MELELGLKVTRTTEDVSSSVDFRFSKDPFGPLVLSQETDSRFIIIIHLKGFKKEGIEIDINKEGDRITIRGRKPVEEMVMIRWMAWRKEVEMRAFKKVFLIPDFVDLDKIKARFDDDDATLTITMPKRVKGISGFNLEQEEEEEEESVDFGDVSEVENREDVEEENVEREESDEQSETQGEEGFGEMMEDKERESQVFEGEEEAKIEDDDLEKIPQIDEQDKVFEFDEEEAVGQQELADSDIESEDSGLEKLLDIKEEIKSEDTGSGAVQETEEQQSDEDSGLKNLLDIIEQEDKQAVMEEKVSEEAKSDDLKSEATEEIEEQASDEDSGLKNLPGMIEKEDSQEVIEQKVSEDTNSDDTGPGAVQEIEKQESDDESGLKNLEDIIEQEDNQEVMEHKVSEEIKSFDTGSEAVKETEEQESDDDSGLKNLRDIIEQEVIDQKVSEEAKSNDIGSGAVEETEKQETDEVVGTSKKSREMKNKKTDGGDDDNDGLRKAQRIKEPERYNKESKIQEMVEEETCGQEKIKNKDSKGEFDGKEAQTEDEDLEKRQQTDEEGKVSQHEIADSVTESEDSSSLRKPTDILEQDVKKQNDSQAETRSDGFGSGAFEEIQKQEPRENDDGLRKAQGIREAKRRNEVRKNQEMVEGETSDPEKRKNVKMETKRKDPKEDVDAEIGEGSTPNTERTQVVSETETKLEEHESEKPEADEVDKKHEFAEKKAEENTKVRRESEDRRSLVKLKENKEQHSKGQKQQEKHESIKEVVEEEAPEAETNIENDVQKQVQEAEASEVDTIVKTDDEGKDKKKSMKMETAPNIAETETKPEDFESEKQGADEVDRMHKLVEKKQEEDDNVRAKGEDKSLIKLKEDEEPHSKGRKQQEKQESIKELEEEKTQEAEKNIGNDVPRPVQETEHEKGASGKVMEQKVSEETKSDNIGSGAVEEMEKKITGGQEKNAKEESKGKETQTEDEIGKILESAEEKNVGQQEFAGSVTDNRSLRKPPDILEQENNQEVMEQKDSQEETRSDGFGCRDSEEIEKQEPCEQLDGASKGREKADDDGLSKVQGSEEPERRNAVRKIQEMVEGETSDHEKRKIVKMETINKDSKEDVDADIGKGSQVVAETETKAEELEYIKREADEEDKDTKVRRESEDRRSLVKLKENKAQQDKEENIKELVKEKAPEAETSIANDVAKPVQETEASEVENEGKEKKKKIVEMETAPKISETETKPEDEVDNNIHKLVEKKDEEDANVRAKGEDNILTKLQENEEPHSQGRKGQDTYDDVKELVEEKIPEAETDMINDVPKPVQKIEVPEAGTLGETGDEVKEKKSVANIVETETKPEDFESDEVEKIHKLVGKKEEEDEKNAEAGTQSEDISSIKPQEAGEQLSQGQKPHKKHEKINELAEEETAEAEKTIENGTPKPVQEETKDAESRKPQETIRKQELDECERCEKESKTQELVKSKTNDEEKDIAETVTKEKDSCRPKVLGEEEEKFKELDEEKPHFSKNRKVKDEEDILEKKTELGDDDIPRKSGDSDPKEKVDAEMGKGFAPSIAETETKPEDFESEKPVEKKEEEDANVRRKSEDRSLIKLHENEEQHSEGRKGQDKQESIKELVEEKAPEEETNVMNDVQTPVHQELEPEECRHRSECRHKKKTDGDDDGLRKAQGIEEPERHNEESKTQVMVEEETGGQEKIKNKDAKGEFDGKETQTEHEDLEKSQHDFADSVTESEDSSSLRKPTDILEQDVMMEQKDTQRETRSDGFGSRALDEIEKREPHEQLDGTSKRREMDDDDDDGLRKVQGIEEPERRNEVSKINEMVEGETSDPEKRKNVKMETKSNDPKDDVDAEMGEGITTNIERRRVAAEDDDIAETETKTEELESEKPETDEVDKKHELFEKKEEEDESTEVERKSEDSRRNEEQHSVENNVPKPVHETTAAGDEGREKKKMTVKKETEPNFAETETKSESQKVEPDEVEKIHKPAEKIEEEEEDANVRAKGEDRRSLIKQLQEDEESHSKVRNQQEKNKELVEEKAPEAEKNNKQEFADSVTESGERSSLRKPPDIILEQGNNQAVMEQKDSQEETSLDYEQLDGTSKSRAKADDDGLSKVQGTEEPEKRNEVRKIQEMVEGDPKEDVDAEMGEGFTTNIERTPVVAEDDVEETETKATKPEADKVDKKHELVEKKEEEEEYNTKLRKKREDRRSLIKVQENEEQHENIKEMVKEKAPVAEENIVNDVPKPVQKIEAPNTAVAETKPAEYESEKLEADDEVDKIHKLVEKKKENNAEAGTQSEGIISSIKPQKVGEQQSQGQKQHEKIVEEKTIENDTPKPVQEETNDDVPRIPQETIRQQVLDECERCEKESKTQELVKIKTNDEEKEEKDNEETEIKEKDSCRPKLLGEEEEKVKELAEEKPHFSKKGKVKEKEENFQEKKTQLGDDAEMSKGVSPNIAETETKPEDIESEKLGEDEIEKKEEEDGNVRAKSKDSSLVNLQEDEEPHSEARKRQDKQENIKELVEEKAPETDMANNILKPGNEEGREKKSVTNILETEKKTEDFQSEKLEADEADKMHKLVEKKEDEDENNSEFGTPQSEDISSINPQGQKQHENIKELVEEKTPEPVQEETNDAESRKPQETIRSEKESKTQKLVKSKANEEEKEEKETKETVTKDQESYRPKELREEEENVQELAEEKPHFSKTGEVKEEEVPEKKTELGDDDDISRKAGDSDAKEEVDADMGKGFAPSVAETETKLEDFEAQKHKLVEKKEEEDANVRAKSEDRKILIKLQEDEEPHSEPQENIKELVEEKAPEAETNVVKPVHQEIEPEVGTLGEAGGKEKKKSASLDVKYRDAKEELDVKLGVPNTTAETETKPDEFVSDQLKADELDNKIHELVGKEDQEKNAKVGTESEDISSLKPQEVREQQSQGQKQHYKQEKIEALVEDKTPEADTNVKDDDTSTPVQERCEEGKQIIPKLTQEETNKKPEEYKEKMVETGKKINEDGSRKVQEIIRQQDSDEAEICEKENKTQEVVKGKTNDEEKATEQTETKEQEYSYKPKILWEEETAEKKKEFGGDDHQISTRDSDYSKEEVDAEMEKGVKPNTAETETKGDEFESRKLEPDEKEEEEKNAKVRRQSEDRRSLRKLQENERQPSKGQKQQKKTAETEVTDVDKLEKTGDEGNEKKKSVSLIAKEEVDARNGKGFAPNTAETETKPEEFESDKLESDELVEKKEEEEEDNDKVRGQSEDSSNLIKKLHETEEQQFQAQKRHNKKEKIKELVEEKTPEADTNTEKMQQESYRPKVFGDDDHHHISRKVGDTGRRDSDAKEESDPEMGKGSTPNISETEKKADTVKAVEEERIHEMVEKKKKKKEENDKVRRQSEDTTLKRLQEEKFQEPNHHNKQVKTKELVEEKPPVQESERPEVETSEDRKVFAETETKDQESYRPKILEGEEDKIQKLSEEKMNISRKFEEEEETAENNNTELSDDDGMSRKAPDLEQRGLDAKKEEKELLVEEKASDGGKKIVGDENDKSRKVQEIDEEKLKVENVESEKKATEVDKRFSDRDREAHQEIEKTYSYVSGDTFQEDRTTNRNDQEEEKEDEADRTLRGTGTVEQELVNLNEQENRGKAQELVDEKINNFKEEEEESETKTDDVIRMVEGTKEYEFSEPKRDHVSKIKEVIEEKIAEAEVEAEHGDLTTVKGSEEKESHESTIDRERYKTKITGTEEPSGQDQKEDKKKHVESMRITEKEKLPTALHNKRESHEKQRYQTQDLVEAGHNDHKDDKLVVKAKQETEEDTSKGVQETEQQESDGLRSSVVQEKKKETEEKEMNRLMEEKETVERSKKTEDVSLRKDQEVEDPEMSKPYKRQEEDKIHEPVGMGTSDYKEKIKIDISRSQERGEPNLYELERHGEQTNIPQGEEKIQVPVELRTHDDREKVKKQDGDVEEEKVEYMAELEEKMEDDSSDKFHEIGDLKSYEDWTHEKRKYFSNEEATDPKESEEHDDKNRAVEEEKDTVEMRTRTEDGNLRKVQEDEDPELSTPYKSQEEDKVHESVEKRKSDYREKVKKQDGDDDTIRRKEEPTDPKDKRTSAAAAAGNKDHKEEEHEGKVIGKGELKNEEDTCEKAQETENQNSDELQETEEKEETRAMEENEIVERRKKTEDVSLREVGDGKKPESSKTYKGPEEDKIQELVEMVRKQGGDDILRSQETEKLDLLEEEATGPRDEHTRGKGEAEEEIYEKISKTETKVEDEINKEVEENQKEEEVSVGDSMTKAQESEKEESHGTEIQKKLDIVQDFVEEEAVDQDDEVAKEAAAVEANYDEDSSRILQTIKEQEEHKDQPNSLKIHYPKVEGGDEERIVDKEAHVQELEGKTEKFKDYNEERRGQETKQGKTVETESEYGIVRKVGETKVQESDGKKEQKQKEKIEELERKETSNHGVKLKTEEDSLIKGQECLEKESSKRRPVGQENIQQLMDVEKRDDEGKSEVGVEMLAKIKEEKVIEGNEKVAEVEMQAKIGIRMKDQETKRQELYELQEDEEHDKIPEPIVEGTKYERVEDREAEEMKKKSEDVSSREAQKIKAEDTDGLEKHRILSEVQKKQSVEEEEEGYKGVLKKTKPIEDSRQSQDVAEKRSDQTKQEKVKELQAEGEQNEKAQRIPQVESKANDNSSEKSEKERLRWQKEDHHEVAEMETSDQRKEEREEKIVGKAVTRDECDSSRKNQKHEEKQLDKLGRHGEEEEMSRSLAKEETSNDKEENRGNRAGAETTIKDDKNQLLAEKDTSGKAKESRDGSSRKNIENEKQESQEQKRNYEEKKLGPNYYTSEEDGKEDKETAEAEVTRKSKGIEQGEATKMEERHDYQDNITDLVEDKMNNQEGEDKSEETRQDKSKEPRKDVGRDKNQPVDSETSEDDSEELEVEVEDSEEDWEAEVVQEMDSDDDSDKHRKIRRIKLGFRLVGGSTLFMSLIVIVFRLIRSKRKLKCYKF